MRWTPQTSDEPRRHRGYKYNQTFETKLIVMTSIIIAYFNQEAFSRCFLSEKYILKNKRYDFFDDLPL
jgi:hypothetical protein